jgi:hypothetical protein
MQTDLALRHARHLHGALMGIIFAFTWVICLGPATVAQAGPKPPVDFSQYDTPLAEQITNHIKEKIAARLGEGKNPRDRYFIIPFAYENRGNDPEFSHSFITVVRVLADKKQPRQGLGFRTGTYKNREYEAYNISWLPEDFTANPKPCVFSGFGSRLFPSLNRCPTSPGKNFNLETTLQFGANAGNAICMWGPYEVRKEAFEVGVNRKKLLDGGTIAYRADDRLTRKKGTAINCFHAMAGLDELYPNGGIFGTGFKMWGINGTTRVLIEYKNQAKIKGLLLEPVDVKKDRIGFVHASSPEARRIYNPFKNKAFAYRK